LVVEKDNYYLFRRKKRSSAMLMSVFFTSKILPLKSNI
jgi:hypothetical protein